MGPLYRGPISTGFGLARLPVKTDADDGGASWRRSLAKASFLQLQLLCAGFSGETLDPVLRSDAGDTFRCRSPSLGQRFWRSYCLEWSEGGAVLSLADRKSVV